MTTIEKFKKLQGIISGLHSVLVAFSGGVDSTFLLKAAALSLPKKRILAVTAVSPTYTSGELARARKFTRELKLKHKIIKTGEHKDKNFIRNPWNRCYFCKKELFRELTKIARRESLLCLLDATNFSDKDDFRPGDKAKKEFGVRSPLVEVKLTKEEIRILSRRLKLPTWNKPNLACLASRIPYGSPITLRALKRIEKAESFLQKLGLSQVRLRDYENSCRIEVMPEEFLYLIKQRGGVIDYLKKLGYDFISLDLEGYRTGSMNRSLKLYAGKNP